MFFLLGDGDVEGGVVFGVGSGIILWSMVWGFSNRSRNLGRDYRRWHRWSRG